MAIGFTGEPVPARSRSGAITQKNDQRRNSSQTAHQVMLAPAPGAGIISQG
jgi:hypothetical protein